MKRHSATNTAVRAVRQHVGGVLRRILDGADEARCRDIERMIGGSGGCLTDEIERRITEYLMRNPSF
jgi:ribose 5-phosphate isomerase